MATWRAAGALRAAEDGRGRRPSLLTGAVVAGCVIYVAVLITSRGSGHAVRAVQDVAASLAALLACVCCFERSRANLEEAPRWRLLGLATACWAVGGVAQSYYELITDQEQLFVPLANLAPLVAVSLAAGAVMSFLPRETRRSARGLLLVDALIATSAILFCSWALLLERVYESSRQIDGTARVLELSQALGVVLVFALVVLVNGRVPRGTQPLGLLGLGLASIAISSSAHLYLTSVGEDAETALANAGWVVGYLLFCLAAIRTRRRSQGGGERALGQAGNIPSYVSVMACIAILSVRAVDGRPPEGLLLWGTIGMLIGLLARQLFAIREKSQLAAELEDQVVLRTAELGASESRLQRVIHTVPDVIMVVADDGVITFASPSVLDVLAHEADELVGRRLADLCAPADRAAVLKFVAGAEATARTLRAEVRLRHRDGSWRFMELAGASGSDSAKDIVLTTRDITDRKKLEAQLRHQAFHDDLTALPNRALFADRLQHALLRAHRSGDTIAVLFIDLDDFKGVNDTLGHESGDALLQRVAARLASALREGDTIARLGGDEFAVLLEGGDDSEAEQLAERLSGSLRLPFVIGERRLHVTASIGLSFLDGPEKSAQELMRNADIAMYDAKRGGKGRYRVFEQVMHEQVVERQTVQEDLRRALRDGQFLVLYQPQLEVSTGRLRGFEALLRWQHPTRGMVGPSEFIADAEETGLISAIGEWVLRAACAQLRAWDAAGTTDPTVGVSVNVSGRQLAEPHFVDLVERVLSDSDLAPGRLTLELTETVLLEHVEATVEKLRGLKALGVRLAIDDFGTGYSSLSYLRDFPVDVLKIDRSFVSAIGGGDSAAGDLVRTMVNLGQTLRLLVVAEGIEDEDQAHALDDMGCRLAQGYYYGRPLLPDEVVELAERAEGKPVVASTPSSNGPPASDLGRRAHAPPVRAD